MTRPDDKRHAIALMLPQAMYGHMMGLQKCRGLRSPLGTAVTAGRTCERYICVFVGSLGLGRELVMLHRLVAC